MSQKSQMPEQLMLGNVLHRRLQEDWRQNAKDVAKGMAVKPEMRIRKPDGRWGRIDVYVPVESADDPDGILVAVVEIKGTNWDTMLPENVRRNARRQIRQICNYIDACLVPDTKVSVSPGIIFPRYPRTPGLKEMIESMFGEEQIEKLEYPIQVVWEDESIEDGTHAGEEG